MPGRRVEQHRVGDPLAGLHVAGHHCRGAARVDEAPLGRLDPERAVGARVGRDVVRELVDAGLGGLEAVVVE